MIHFIALDFPAWWAVPAALVFIGGPLLTILMILRAVTHTGWARYLAIATVLVMTGTFQYVQISPPSHPDAGSLLSVIGVAFVVVLALWLASMIAARRYRFWTDAIALLIPLGTGIGVWLSQ